MVGVFLLLLLGDGERRSFGVSICIAVQLPWVGCVSTLRQSCTGSIPFPLTPQRGSFTKQGSSRHLKLLKVPQMGRLRRKHGDSRHPQDTCAQDSQGEGLGAHQWEPGLLTITMMYHHTMAPLCNISQKPGLPLSMFKTRA